MEATNNKRHVKKIKVFGSTNVVEFENDVNSFTTSHKVINVTYRSEYVNSHHCFFYNCCVEYEECVEEYS